MKSSIKRQIQYDLMERERKKEASESFRRAPYHIADHMDEIIKMREEGMTVTQIKEATGFCVSSISQHLKAAGYGKQNMRGDTEKIDESKLTYAKPRTIPQAQVKAGGRTYTDVTGLYIGI